VHHLGVEVGEGAGEADRGDLDAGDVGRVVGDLEQDAPPADATAVVLAGLEDQPALDQVAGDVGDRGRTQVEAGGDVGA
jgi:hypothetical protein